MKSPSGPRQSAPSFGALLGELRVLADLGRGWRLGPGLASTYDAGGKPALVLPGFLASDGSTIMLRRTLRAANFRTYGWKQGRNLRVDAGLLERLDQRMDHIQREDKRPVSLVGWSLGGLIAREYAKYAPDRVDRVITLGSPFSGDIHANHAWRLYELINWQKVAHHPMIANVAIKPPVPTYAIWSAHDGVVAPECARGQPHETDHAIEVACGHMGFTTDEASLRAILSILSA